MNDRVILLNRQLTIARLIHGIIWTACGIEMTRMTERKVTGWHYGKLGLALVVDIPRGSEITPESVLDPRQHGAYNCGDIEFYANNEFSVIFRTVEPECWFYHPAEPSTAPIYMEILMDAFVAKLTPNSMLQTKDALQAIIYYIRCKKEEMVNSEDLTVGSRTVPRIE